MLPANGGVWHTKDQDKGNVPRTSIIIEMTAAYEKLTGERLGELSALVAARVEAARERQRKRFASHDSRVVCNADMTPADVRVFCKLDATGQSLMQPQVTAVGDAATTTERACVSSSAQDRADDCRFGRERRDRPGASG